MGVMKFWVHLCFVLSALSTNSVLIVLIINHSPPKLGNYKHLMGYFSVMSIEYAILDFLVEPYIYSHRASFVIMMNINNAIFENHPQIALFVMSWLAGCFGVIIYAIAINFIFRYYALQREGRLRYFSGKLLLVWMGIPFLTGFISSAVCWLMGPREYMTEYLKDGVMQKYGFDITKMVYSGSVYWKDDANGVCRFNWDDLSYITALNVLMAIPVISIVYFGAKSYKRIKNLILQGESDYSRKLQTQLYYALVAQTLIPAVFLFLPVALFYVAPLVGWNIEWASIVFAFLFGLYPVFDPIPSIFMIDAYRNALFNVFRRCLPNRYVTPGTSQLSTGNYF